MAEEIQKPYQRHRYLASRSLNSPLPLLKRLSSRSRISLKSMSAQFPAAEDENPWVEVVSPVTLDPNKRSKNNSINNPPKLDAPFTFVPPEKQTYPREVTEEQRVPAPSTRTRPIDPRSPSKKISYIHGFTSDLIFGVCLVNFHHLRGPEVEYSFPPSVATDASKRWPYLPFQALPDGAHAFEETFSYFTLEYFDQEDNKPTTLFAIACARQIKSDDLLEKDDDVTRSSVQKSIVVILRQPIFGQIKEKLSVVTKAFFEQKNFNDKTIVDALYQSLQALYSENSPFVDESDFYSGLSVRDLLKDLSKNVLVIVKAMLLEKKVAFYGSDPTKLCLTIFSTISLIPNLINNLLDSSAPSLNEYAKHRQITTSFKTSDRNSVLDFAGLPLQVFGKGGIFSPYSPLQQFEDLKTTDYYTIGTSNALLLNHKSKLADVLINLDTNTIEIINQELVPSLTLSSPDKKWMTQLLHAVSLSNSESYSGFLGGDDYIRWQFEDYFTGLLATAKYDIFLHRYNPPQDSREYDGNQLKNFNPNFIAAWKTTENYKLFIDKTDDHIFDVFEPKHVYSDESKSLTEKFQQFKMDNSKKFEEYRKNLLGKESLKQKPDLEKHPDITDVSSGEVGGGVKKSHSPGRIWNWYSKKKEKDHE